MRNLNIKKLVAVAAGAVLVGSALAPMASAISLEKSDLVSSSGVTVDVVVGKKAAVSDAVWAGNIAAAVASKAYAEKEVAVGAADCSGGATPSVTGLTVDLSVGGTTSVTGGKTFFNNMDSATGATEANFNGQLVTESSIPSLYYNGAKGYTFNGTAYTISIQERLFFTADVKFDAQFKDNLVALIEQDSLKYNLSLGSGIPRYEGDTGTVNFSDDSNDNIRIPFFGSDYLVKTVTTSYVELIKTAGETRYSEGDSITDLEGYDGELYYIEVGPGGLAGSTQKIQLSLYKEDGTLIKSDNFAAGDVVFYGDDTGEPVLNTLINISEILSQTVSDAVIYTPTILVGSSRILLYNNKGYPYDTTKPSLEDYDWQVSLGWGGTSTRYLTDINISNTSVNTNGSDNGLPVGEEADFPEGVGNLKFLGLQLPEFTGVSKTERTTIVEFKNKNLYYKDNTYEASHVVPMYLRGSASNGTASTFTIDGKDIYYKVSTADINVDGQVTNNTNDGNTCITNGQYINGEMVNLVDINSWGGTAIINGTIVTMGTTADINGMQFRLSGIQDGNACIYLTADGNVTFRKENGTGTVIQEIYYVDQNVTGRTSTAGAPINFEGVSSQTHNYEWMVDESLSSLWLFFDSQALTTQYGKTINLVGTDTVEDKLFSNYNFYLPHTSMLSNHYEGDSNYSDTELFLANFQINEDETSAPLGYDFNFFVDTGTGYLVALPNTQLSNNSVGAEADWNGGAWTITESTTSSRPSWVYTDFGSKIVLSNHEYKITMPENRPQAEILISGTGTSTTVSGGEDITVAEGETGSTTSGTRVTVTAVNYDASCTGGTGTGSGTCTVTPTSYMQPFAVSNLVKYDDSTSTATHIIVGGWKVNKMAENVTLDDGSTLKSKLTKTGDYVVEKTSNGDIVVAGYRGLETGNAAQELINAIDNL